MLKWAIVFAIAAVVLGALGFGGLAGASMGIAKILFVAFLIIAIIFLFLGLTATKKIT